MSGLSDQLAAIFQISWREKKWEQQFRSCSLSEARVDGDNSREISLLPDAKMLTKLILPKQELAYLFFEPFKQKLQMHETARISK